MTSVFFSLHILDNNTDICAWEGDESKFYTNRTIIIYSDDCRFV